MKLFVIDKNIFIKSKYFWVKNIRTKIFVSGDKKYCSDTNFGDKMSWVRRPATRWRATPRLCCRGPTSEVSTLGLPMLHPSTRAPSPDTSPASDPPTASARPQVNWNNRISKNKTNDGENNEHEQLSRISSKALSISAQVTPAWCPDCQASPSRPVPGSGPRRPRRTTWRTTPRWRWNTRSSGRSSTATAPRWSSPSQAGKLLSRYYHRLHCKIIFLHIYPNIFRPKYLDSFHCL